MRPNVSVGSCRRARARGTAPTAGTGSGEIGRQQVHARRDGVTPGGEPYGNEQRQQRVPTSPLPGVEARWLLLTRRSSRRRREWVPLLRHACNGSITYPSPRQQTILRRTTQATRATATRPTAANWLWVKSMRKNSSILVRLVAAPTRRSGARSVPWRSRRGSCAAPT